MKTTATKMPTTNAEATAALSNSAIARLHAEAPTAGAQPSPHRRGEADYSSHLHGVESPPRCVVQPCRLGGLCHALYEVWQYQNEAQWGRPFLDAADEAGKFRAASAAFMETLAPVLHRVFEMHNRVPFHDHAICARAVRVFPSAVELTAELSEWEDAMRGLVWSEELRQPKGKKPAELLLTAVCQHLRWGGITYTEIARLVLGDGSRHAAERIRKRVKESVDARSLVPFELRVPADTTVGPRPRPQTGGRSVRARVANQRRQGRLPKR